MKKSLLYSCIVFSILIIGFVFHSGKQSTLVDATTIDVISTVKPQRQKIEIQREKPEKFRKMIEKKREVPIDVLPEHMTLIERHATAHKSPFDSLPNNVLPCIAPPTNTVDIKNASLAPRAKLEPKLEPRLMNDGVKDSLRDRFKRRPANRPNERVPLQRSRVNEPRPFVMHTNPIAPLVANKNKWTSVLDL